MCDIRQHLQQLVFVHKNFYNTNIFNKTISFFKQINLTFGNHNILLHTQVIFENFLFVPLKLQSLEVLLMEIQLPKQFFNFI